MFLMKNLDPVLLGSIKLLVFLNFILQLCDELAHVVLLVVVFVLEGQKMFV